MKKTQCTWSIADRRSSRCIVLYCIACALFACHGRYCTFRKWNITHIKDFLTMSNFLYCVVLLWKKKCYREHRDERISIRVKPATAVNWFTDLCIFSSSMNPIHFIVERQQNNLLHIREISRKMILNSVSIGCTLSLIRFCYGTVITKLNTSAYLGPSAALTLLFLFTR